jgi:hypothetical protein
MIRVGQQVKHSSFDRGGTVVAMHGNALWVLWEGDSIPITVHVSQVVPA